MMTAVYCNRIGSRSIGPLKAMALAMTIHSGQIALAETSLPEITVTGEQEKVAVPSTPLDLLIPEVRISGTASYLDGLAVVPSAYAGNPVNGIFALRGINQENIFTALITGSNPLVTVLENGVPLSPTLLRNLPPPMWGMQSSVVLNGPQIHLRGPNALAGALLIDTVAPAFTNTGSLQAEIASYNSFQAGLSQNLVLIPDRLAMSLNHFHQETDGYETNLGPHGDELGGFERDRNELRLRWITDPVQDGWIDLSVVYDKLEGNPVAYVREMESHAFFDRKQMTETPGDYPSDRWSASLQMNLPLVDGLRFKSTTGIQRFDGESAFDLDGSDFLKWYAIGFTDEMRFTQHFGLEGESDTVRWQIGAYYEDSEYTKGYDGMGGAPVPLGTEFHNYMIEDVTIAALDARFDWEFSPSWHLIAGTRLNYENHEMSNWSIYGPLPKISDADEITDTAVIPQIAVEWHPDEQSVVAAKLSRAYRAGGISYAANLGIEQPFDEEDGWEFEASAGRSTESFDFRTSAFYSRLNDMQVVYDANGGFPGIDTLITNSADAHRYGIEFETRWRPTPELSFLGTLGWLHTHFDTLEMGTIDGAGSAFPNAPEWTASFGVDYRHSSGFFSSVLFSYADSTYSRADHPGSTPIETRKLLSARIGYQWSNYQVYLFGTNLLDDEYAVYRVDNTAIGGPVQGKAGPPRLVGIGCEVKW